MDYKDTFLMAIQTVPGKTAAEKHKYINVTAQEIADKKQEIETLSKPLRPLMSVEVAKVTNELDLIVEALQTSEALLCSRALQIPDLFPSEDSPLLNWDHFNNLLLSRISLTTRYKLIKKVSQDLQKKNPKHAETFFTKVDEHYGQKEALPLLLACSETFVNQQLRKLQIILPPRYYFLLYAKYPEILVSYLTTVTNLDNKDEGISRKVHVDDFSRFLPNLIENHHSFMISVINKCFDSGWYCRVRFGKRRTKMFLKKAPQVVIEKPNRFLSMLSLSIVSGRLSEDEFSTMLSNCIKSCKMVDFDYARSVKSFLFYFSDEKRVSLTKAAFKKTFGKNLIDCPDNISPELLEILPVEERVRIARIKLEKDPSWNYAQAKNSWRAYLPFNEAFELAKTQIAKSSDPKEREQLIQLLIFSSKINNDKNGLLEVLKYFATRHKNVKLHVIESIFSTVKKCYDLSKLDQEHWDIFIDLAKRLLLGGNTWQAIEILQAGIRFKVKNNLEPDDYISLYLKHNNKSWNKFCIFNDDLYLEGKCLRKFIDMIEASYTVDKVEDNYESVSALFGYIKRYNDQVISRSKTTNTKQYWISRFVNLQTGSSQGMNYQFANVQYLFSSANDDKANADQKKQGENQCSLINLDDHPQFIKFAEETVYSDPRIKSRHNYDLKSCFRQYYPHLYKKWYPNETEFISRIGFDEIRDLKHNYEKVCSMWSSYYEQCIANIPSAETKIFLKSLLWYDALPKDFLSRGIQEIKEIDKMANVPLMVAILLGGPEYEKLMAPMIPEDPNLDLNDDDSLKLRTLITSFVAGAKLSNPPVSLDTMKKLFSSDYLRICGEGLSSMVCRMPTPTVVNFCSGFLDERVAVKKLMVELMCKVAPLEEKWKLFEGFLLEKCHTSIFGHVLNKSLTIFLKDPNERSWTLIRKGLRSRVIEDPTILRNLLSFEVKSNVYLMNYMEEILSIFDKVNIEGYPDLRKELMEGVFQKLRAESMSTVLSESFQKQLMQKYIFDSLMDASKPQMNVYFIYDVFLRGDNLEKKEAFFLECVYELVCENFGKMATSGCGEDLYPANSFFRQIVDIFVCYQYNKETKVNKTLLNGLSRMFQSVIKPWEDTQSYLYLEWIKGFEGRLLSPKEFAEFFGRNLREWHIMFGPEFMHEMKDIVDRFMHNVFGKNNDIYSFIDGLLEVKNRISYICAALFVHHAKPKLEKVFFDNVMEKLLETDIPTIRYLLYENKYHC